MLTIIVLKSCGPVTLPSPMPFIYSSLRVKLFFSINQTVFLDADNNILEELRPCDSTFSNASP